MKPSSAKLKALAGIGTTLVFSLALAAAAQAQVAITINGNAVDVSPEPMIQGGRVFVPLRGVFENLGASVVYDNGRINAQGNANSISLHIGSTQATVNGDPATIDVAPFIVGASTYVPLRFVSQALGADVAWDESDRLVAITMSGLSADDVPPPSYVAQANYDVNEAPPPIPDYTPPPVPDQNDIWQPGYWAWGDAGYYWVPGVWVAPPQPGYVWTPGYWAFRNGLYGFIAGFWGTHVGFYGGINYGGGYYGNGYGGGRWVGNTFHYNTAVVRVTNTTIVHNVYVDRTVINNNGSHVSYNGGPRGITTRPTQAQLTVNNGRRLPMTSAQVQHVHYAANDRQLLSRVNHGAPPVVAAPHPFTAAAKPAGPPVTAQDRAAAQHAIVRPPAARPPAQRPQPAAPARPMNTQPQHPAPAQHRPPPQMQRPAPAQHPQPQRPAPAQHRPAPQMQRPAPAQHPQPQIAHPQPQHPAPQQARPHPAAPAEHPHPADTGR